MMTLEQRDEIGTRCPACKIVINGEKIRAQLKALFTFVHYKIVVIPSSQFDRTQLAVSVALEPVGQAAVIAGVFKPFSSSAPPLQAFDQAIEHIRLTVANICEKAEPDSGLTRDQGMGIIALFNQCEDGLDQALFEITTS